MGSEDFIWVDNNHSFFDIKNNSTFIKWSGKPYEDLKNLSEVYFYCAYDVCNAILEVPDNNSICDTWFFPAIYMFRQSIELILKSLICKDVKNKHISQKIFLSHKHNLRLLFLTYKEIHSNMLINDNECIWIEEYLKNIEYIDSNSDLFRYPFTDEFYDEYKDKFFDIVDMGNNFLNAYTILMKCDTGIENKEITDIDVNLSTDFIIFAKTGYGNCFIWRVERNNDFYLQVNGYNRVAEFLFNKLDDSKVDKEIYPIMFLLRNAIELGLKRLLYSRTEKRLPKHKIIRVRNSHLLYKDLWYNIKGMLEHYAKERDEDLQTLRLFEEHIQELSKIDKNGDLFRYPFSYSFEYKFNNLYIDIKNIYYWMKGMYNLLDGCDSMLDEIADYESEMASYYYLV